MATPSPEPSPESSNRRTWSELVNQARKSQHSSVTSPALAIDVRQRVQQQIMQEASHRTNTRHETRPVVWWEDILNLFQWRWVPVTAAVTLAITGYVGWTLRDVLDEMDLYAEVHQVLLLDL